MLPEGLESGEGAGKLREKTGPEAGAPSVRLPEYLLICSFPFHCKKIKTLQRSR